MEAADSLEQLCKLRQMWTLLGLEMSGMSCVNANAADPVLAFTCHCAGKALQWEKPGSQWNLDRNIPRGFATLYMPCLEALQT